METQTDFSGYQVGDVVDIDKETLKKLGFEKYAGRQFRVVEVSLDHRKMCVHPVQRGRRLKSPIILYRGAVEIAVTT